MNHPVLQVLAHGNIAGFPRADRTDGQLLDSFIHARDEDAFATVVRRHGPMVLAVCRRVLGNHADADDAFQAAFLVLLRKAGSLGTRRPLGPWLHGVAFNTARRLQRANRRRAANERTVAQLPERAASETVSLSVELLAILDEELSRLPERYRVPIVLCDLEGLTRREVAVQLGCPEGTVAGRLARARELLATRVAARGVVPSAGVLAILLTQRCLNAVTPDRVDSVVRMASGGAVPARVSSVVERVVSAMFVKKVKSLAAVLLVCGLIAAAGIGLRGEAVAGPEPAAPPEEKAARAVAATEKVLTVIPLRKLDPEETAATITRMVKGVVVAAIPDERSLLVYADAKTTTEVQALVLKWGEATGKQASRIRLDRTMDCRETAQVINEVFNGPKARASTRVTVVPVPDENAILVYATPIDVLSIRSLVKALDEGPAPTARGEKGPAAEPKEAAEPRKYTFDFSDTPWTEVLAWYGKEGKLTPILTILPTGNVTIASPKDRKLTLGEVTDLINELLMPQKLILIRRSVSFYIHPADERVGPDRIPRIELSELKNRGKTELVQVVIPLKAGAQEDLAAEVRRLLSPFGNVTLVKNTLVILDTAGNIMRVHDLLRQVGVEADREQTSEPKGKTSPELRKFNVLPGTADEVAKALLAVNPKLKCIAVQAANEVWVMATPEEHTSLAEWFKLIAPKKDAGRDK
jgi:RNA polymerase sigma factor (sigma-70 family)